MNYPKIGLSAALMVGVAASLASPVQAYLGVRSVPPASFLNYHVDTVPQLTFEVTYDRVVQARLAHHFHLSGPAMCAYVQKNLSLKRLAVPYRTRVYCLSPKGREYFVLMTLKPGTPVFALRRTGQPILRLVCGNPLVASLPPSPRQAAAPVHPHPPVSHVKAATLGGAVTPASSASPAALAPTASGASLPTVTTVSGASSEVLFTSGGSLTSGGGAPGWLAWLPVAGGLFGVLTHGGGSGSSSGGGSPSTTVTSGGGTHPLFPVHGIPTTPGGPTTPGLPIPSGAPVPVPEPGPGCVLLTGALMLGLRRTLRRRP